MSKKDMDLRIKEYLTTLQLPGYIVRNSKRQRVLRVELLTSGSGSRRNAQAYINIRFIRTLPSLETFMEDSLELPPALDMLPCHSFCFHLINFHQRRCLGKYFGTDFSIICFSFFLLLFFRRFLSVVAITEKVLQETQSKNCYYTS